MRRSSTTIRASAGPLPRSAALCRPLSPHLQGRRSMSVSNAAKGLRFWRNTLLFGLPLATAGGAYHLYSTSGEPDMQHVPGSKRSLLSRILDFGASKMQSRPPIDAIHAHLCGAHFYSGDMQRQVLAHHYCNHHNEDVHQCIIYDSNEPNARLIGVEYIISEKLFKQLPEEEKQYWHSHTYEVKSGMLVAPGIPNVAEHKLMEHLITTYGKTWHTWQVDRGDALPLGPPQLMMAFSQDGQLKAPLAQEIDKIANSKMEERRKGREDIQQPVKQLGADSWEQGFALQTVMRRVESVN